MRVKKMSRGDRLAKAKEWAADPVKLIQCYTSSVRDFEAYDNRTAHFLSLKSKRGDLPARCTEITSGDELVAWIAPTNDSPRQGFDVRGRPDLSVDYVEREVSIMRTTDRATWDTPDVEAYAGGALLPDLLLKNRGDRTPVIGEIKVTRRGTNTTDKDTVVALVQALAGVAHLATESQYARLSHFDSTSFNALNRARNSICT